MPLGIRKAGEFQWTHTNVIHSKSYRTWLEFCRVTQGVSYQGQRLKQMNLALAHGCSNHAF